MCSFHADSELTNRGGHNDAEDATEPNRVPVVTRFSGSPCEFAALNWRRW
jgi:hypothetical protein